MKEVMLNEHEVAALLRVSISTVRRWRRVQEGPPFYKFGKAVRYPQPAIADYIKTRVVLPKAKEETVEAAG